MPKVFVIIMCIIVIFAWFVLGEKKSLAEKCYPLVILLIIYLMYQLLNGVAMKDSLKIIWNYFTG